MRIAYLAAGAANMYCGSCLHDNTLAAALIDAKQDILLIPTYTPLRTDEPGVSDSRIFFGGINVYLQDKLPWLKHLPRAWDRWLNAPWLLGLLGKFDLSVDARQLGSLTIAMLEGESGRVQKEVFRLADWLADDIQPTIIHLSNALLLGMVRSIKRRLDVPIVCGLSGEDIFFEKLPPRYREQAQRIMRERAAEVDCFVAMNEYYAAAMRDYLQIPAEKVAVVPHGLKLAGHGTRRGGDDAFSIGYLARVCHDKGLHLLVDAFGRLLREPGLPPLRLRAAGYLGRADQPYLDSLRRRIEAEGWSDRFEYRGEITREEKIDFLQSLDVMSVPTVYRESKGLSIYEALANAVPTVLPRHGSFVEIVEQTGGGLLFEPENTDDLAKQLKRLILDPAEAESLGLRGQAAVRERHTDHHMAENTLALYRRVIEASRAAPAR